MNKKVFCAFLALFILAGTFSVFALEEEYDLSYYEKFKGKDKSINVYNWGEYISDGSDDSVDVNKEFEKLTGIKVNYVNFATNEELYSKLRSGGANYDIVIPSDYMIGKLISENMLLELDFDNIPNFENIDEQFLSADFDPENAYSVPYTWGHVGIVYNRDLVADESDTLSWDILWDEKYMGEILMFANSRDAFMIAQMKNGFSVNTTSFDELDGCLKDLIKQKPLVQAFVMDEIFDKMLGGEAILAPYYAGDALTMIDSNPALGFSVPLEGTNIFIDSLCIPKGAKEKEAAEMYINFMLEPEIGAANSEYIGYATPNMAAKELLDEEITDSPIVYPSEEEIERMQFYNALPPEVNSYIDSLWTELLSNDDNYSRMLVPVLMVLALMLSVGINILRHYKKTKKQYF